MIKFLMPIFLLYLAGLADCRSKDMSSSEISKAALGGESDTDKKVAKNIILLIGDGMGLGQITGGLYSNSNKLNLERFKVIGLHKSHSFDKLITDSASGATAFSCGLKTYNGAIGVDPDTASCETILELAQKAGKSTGLVTTSTIVHATPASFAAHQPHRKMYEEIAADMADAGLDYFVGGGKKYFDRRDDGRNLIEELKKNGYVVGDFFNENFEDAKMPTEGKFGFLTSDGDPLPVTQGRDYFQRAALSAIPFLGSRSDEGYFLLIEGAQIDWGGHANKANYIITELLEFDSIIGKVLDFAEQDGNTLVIVTADHETGGFSINQDSKMDSLVTAFTTDYHTATMIPVFAFGPGAEQFSGIYENTSIFDKMRKAGGL